jgi:hypothetical protein
VIKDLMLVGIAVSTWKTMPLVEWAIRRSVYAVQVRQNRNQL